MKSNRKKDFQDSSRRGRPRFRTPKFDPNTDDHISFLQVLYGEYHRGFPVIERVWVYEKYRFNCLKSEVKPEAFYYHDGCGGKVCGPVVFESRTKQELAELEKVKNKEFRIAWNRLTGWNYFSKKPDKEEMMAFINTSMLKKK